MTSTYPDKKYFFMILNCNGVNPALNAQKLGGKGNSKHKSVKYPISTITDGNV